MQFQVWRLNLKFQRKYQELFYLVILTSPFLVLTYFKVKHNKQLFRNCIVLQQLS